MMIKNIEFISFGGLLNKKISLNDGVNIIYGKNESGKSTIAEGVITLFYGIYPTSKEKNPLVNWNQNELNIKGVIENDQDYYTVSRELMSQPIGSIKKDTDLLQISNRTLKFIKRISLPLYRDLYCTDTRRIDQLQRDTWEKVDSQMIFSYDQTNINKPEAVLKSIDDELNQIWRESNRGSYRLKTIEEEINQLKNEQSQLIHVYKRIKKEIEEIDALKLLIKNQKDQLSDLEAKRRKIKKLMPIANICIEKENLEKEYENYSDYSLLSKDIIDDRRLLIEQIKSNKEEILALEESIEKKNLEKKVFSDKEVLIIENKGIINRKLIELEELINHKKNLDTIATKEKLLLKEYNQLFYKIFNKVCTKEDFNKVKKISVKEINQYSINKKIILISILSLLAGGLLYYFNQSLISILFFSIGFGSIIALFSNKNSHKQFKGLNFSSEAIEKYEILKEKEFQMLSLLEEKKQLSELVFKEVKELKRFFEKYVLVDDLQSILNYVNNIFNEIENKRDKNNSLEFLIKEFKISLNQKQRVLKGHREELDTINHFLIEMSQSSVEKGIEVFKNNRKIEEQIEHLDEKIEKTENGQLLLDEFKNFKESVSSERLDAFEIEIDKLHNQIGENQVSLAKLEEKIENVSITEEIQSIETEIDLMIIEKKGLVKRKNQLLAMKEVIQKSNESFKEDYQPDIVKDANKYFNAFTQSKYDKIFINPETKDVYLDLGKYNKEINSGFSRGTMDQLFLALRLGVIKHYERDIKLPFFFDEFFSNWDQERLRAFVDVLKIIQKERQVIITTCKKNIVSTFRKLMTVKLIEIEGDGYE